MCSDAAGLDTPVRTTDEEKRAATAYIRRQPDADVLLAMLGLDQPAT